MFCGCSCCCCCCVVSLSPTRGFLLPPPSSPPPPPFSSLLCQDSTHIILYGTPAFTLHPRSVRPKDRSRLQHGAPSSCHASNLSAKMPNSSIDKQLPCVPLQAFSTPSFQTRAQIATNMCLSSACLLLFTLWPCHLESRRNTPAAVKFQSIQYSDRPYKVTANLQPKKMCVCVKILESKGFR